MIKVKITVNSQKVPSLISLPISIADIAQTEEVIVIYDQESGTNLKISGNTSLEDLIVLARRFASLSEDERNAAVAIIDAIGCTLEDALDIVKRGDFAFYLEYDSLQDLAYDLVRNGDFGDVKAMGILIDYIDYDRLVEYMKDNGFHKTSRGIIQILL